MGRKGKELTTEQKKLIVRLSEDNVSGLKISEIMGINRFTIANFLKRYRMRENASRSGRPKLTDARTDGQLLRAGVLSKISWSPFLIIPAPNVHLIILAHQKIIFFQ
jgi:IS30 family transposase